MMRSHAYRNKYTETKFRRKKGDCTVMGERDSFKLIAIGRERGRGGGGRGREREREYYVFMGHLLPLMVLVLFLLGFGSL